MKILRSILISVALGLVLVVPALADTGQGGDTQQDTVTKTFKLTLNGNVPEDQVFEVTYGIREEIEQGLKLSTIQFCGPGPDPENSPRVSEEACKGNGTVYTPTVEFPRGSQIAFRYFTLRPGDVEGTFVEFHKSYDGEMPDGPEDYETLTSDVTNSAWYSFGGDQQAPSQMPATGSGGAARGSGLPMAAVSLIFPILLAGGYTLRRRNQGR